MGLLLTAISFSGIILIMQPEFLFPKATESSEQSSQLLGLLVIVAAFCFSLNMQIVHSIGNRITMNTNLHYSYMGQVVLSSTLSQFSPA